MCKDKTIIDALGGPSKVAKDFGFSVQRVSNWGRRGIPADVILDTPMFADRLRDAGYTRPTSHESTQ
jgi:hypothetical protein